MTHVTLGLLQKFLSRLPLPQLHPHPLPCLRKRFSVDVLGRVIRKGEGRCLGLKPSRVDQSYAHLLVGSLGPSHASLQSSDLTDFKTGRTGSAHLSRVPGSTPWEPSRIGDAIPLAHRGKATCLVMQWVVGKKKQVVERLGAKLCSQNAWVLSPSFATRWTCVRSKSGTLPEPRCPL